MKKLFSIFCLVSLLFLFNGCMTPKAPFTTYSTDVGDMTVYPDTQGPVDTFRPIYKVDNSKRIFGTGKSYAEADATKLAIYDACARNNCDYIAAAKRVTKITQAPNAPALYEVTVIGYPVSITGVQQIPVAFYERQPDGSLRRMEQPEHRYVLEDVASNDEKTITTNFKGNVNTTRLITSQKTLEWRPVMLPGTTGKDAVPQQRIHSETNPNR